MVITYCVEHGPDSRHLFECKAFYKKREAIAFIRSLSVDRAYKFTRVEAYSGLSTDGRTETLESRIY